MKTGTIKVDYLARVEGEGNQSSSAIRRWLNDLGLGEYGDAFEQNDLDIDVLRDLSELDLEKIGVSLGHRKKLIRAIAALGPPSALRPAHDRRPMDDAASPTGERRQATVLFSDLSGYTAMSEALDPEDVERVMSRIKSNAVVIVRATRRARQSIHRRRSRGTFRDRERA